MEKYIVSDKKLRTIKNNSEKVIADVAIVNLTVGLNNLEDILLEDGYFVNLEDIKYDKYLENHIKDYLNYNKTNLENINNKNYIYKVKINYKQRTMFIYPGEKLYTMKEENNMFHIYFRNELKFSIKK